ncbi:hypothetical protein [Verrucosispora sp. ts21]|uniref:hypothetical protein n=1 Tax=Verrucosispora sp. ts21 TaxID=2069341 RepID=UPI001E533042|nr:hypothetical protein [Verrucosispora sp. ts21]
MNDPALSPTCHDPDGFKSVAVYEPVDPPDADDANAYTPVDSTADSGPKPSNTPVRLPAAVASPPTSTTAVNVFAYGSLVADTHTGSAEHSGTSGVVAAHPGNRTNVNRSANEPPYACAKSE